MFKQKNCYTLFVENFNSNDIRLLKDYTSACNKPVPSFAVSLTPQYDTITQSTGQLYEFSSPDVFVLFYDKYNYNVWFARNG